MITIRNKWVTTGILILLMLIVSGYGAYTSATDKTMSKINSIEELKGKKLGGVVSRMPSDSARLLFEGILGEKLGSYESFKGMNEVLGALRMGEIDAVWVPDISAKYLLQKYTEFKELDTPDPDADRFEFGLAVKNNDSGDILRTEINTALNQLKQDGTVNGLLEKYLKADEVFTESEMETRKSDLSKDWDTIYIGITGTIPPIDMVDEQGKPNGFCVELMDRIGMLINKNIEFSVLSGETYFSELMAGRIDAVFAYGSGKITVEAKKSWLMTDGYCPCKKYSFITMK